MAPAAAAPPMPTWTCYTPDGVAAKLLRAALILADERGLESVDEGIVLDAADELDLARPRREGDATGTAPRRA